MAWGWGCGFTLALTLLSSIRELVGTGTLLKATDFGFEGFAPFPGRPGGKTADFTTGGLYHPRLVAGRDQLACRPEGGEGA